MKGSVIMKNEKELQELKEKVEALNEELKQLSDDELEQIAGGYPEWVHNKMAMPWIS